MKILAIRIKNLASLEGFTEIDFTQEPLSSAGIFAITGPTGAGKSTILDALCLALYGKTPRYKQGQEAGIDIIDVQGSTINQGDHRGILRDGAGDGYAEVDFMGTDGQIHTATWRVRRARDKADGALQPDAIQLTHKLSGTVFPGKKKETADEIERLVGLNFEQFTRAVLLAQGDFTAFLKAAKDEKSALLEKLTGTRIYSEISRQIFAHYSQLKRVLQQQPGSKNRHLKIKQAMYNNLNNINSLIMGVPLRVGLFAASPRCAAGFPLLSLTQESISNRKRSNFYEI